MQSNSLNQAVIIEFLGQPESYPKPCTKVSVVETHSAMVFLAGPNVYKIKKAVKYPYLDFSSLAKRKAVLERELEINQPHAPQIYLGLVAICQNKQGALNIGGTGDVVEWALHMHRFDDRALLTNAIADGGLKQAFFADLADEIARYHAVASVVLPGAGASRMNAIISELCDAFSVAGDVISADRLSNFCTVLQRRADDLHHRLNQRGRRGYVRRCHGDLHLNNIVVLNNQPVLFDAIEFNEDIATTDTLYDLAFLLMDLQFQNMQVEANIVLNRYISTTNDPANIAALQLLPFFMSCRAAIRAMVAITLMRQENETSATNTAHQKALSYFNKAQEFLQTRQPELVCVGGLSGTGKTTVARHLAPFIGSAPGALHLRSDIERKAVFNVPETERLDASTYTLQISDMIYARLMRKATLALLAGNSVIIDAVFLRQVERDKVEQIAQAAGVPFTGFWLQADPQSMTSRVGARKGDASDATPEVVRKQISMPTGSISWQKIDANASPDQTFENCWAAGKWHRLDA